MDRADARNRRLICERLESRLLLAGDVNVENGMNMNLPGGGPAAEVPVIISEFLASNSTGLATRTRSSVDQPFAGAEQTYDWIEVRNLSLESFDVSGMHLTDDPAELEKWKFPPGTTLAPEGFLVVLASGQDITDPALVENGLMHTNFKLSSSGEYLAITDRDGKVVHDFSAEFPEQTADVSFGIEDGQLKYFSTPTPGAENPKGVAQLLSNISIAPDAGFFESPFQLSLSAAPDASAIIRYTLDGSEPTESNGMVYTAPITLGASATLRAAAFGEDSLPSEVETRTYLFLDEVLTQSPEGQTPPGWPDSQRRINGQVFDYGMDPEIVDSPVWGPQMKDALTQIPSLSLVTDLRNLFDPATGIYVNAAKDGVQWERPTSLELINPDGRPGFQVNAGLRIRGGFSRTGGNPKHSFRLFFRDEYGDAALVFPLFGQEGAEQFQQIDLRTAQNNAWNNGGSTAVRNTFLREIFSRDTQRDMGQPYKRGRFYHLYLNGQYWGLYQTDERSEADYSESYFGGGENDYDVIKATQGIADATDGSLDMWNELWRLAAEGFASDRAYYSVQGMNPDGTDNLALSRHVDIDNLIDYMILIFYTGNTDAPVASIGVNNFFAVRNRDHRDGWKFFAHDSETSMMSIKANEVRPRPIGEQMRHFNPQWLHQRMAEHPEYRLRFADRVHKHFFNDGALTERNASSRLSRRAAEIDLAIIAESARWGDLTRRLYTKDDWLKERDWLINRFFPERTELVLRQLADAGLFPAVRAPSLNQHGGHVLDGFELELSAPAGVIYYTLDGTDPRVAGGTLHPQAMRFPSGSSLELVADAVVSARAWDNGIWSPLSTAQFYAGAVTSATGLRVAEVHYNPADPSPGEINAGFVNNDDFEFIELVNPTDQFIDLNGVKFVKVDVNGQQQGVSFDFANGRVTRLGPSQRVVVVEDNAAFRFRYGDGLPVAGQWTGGLGNGGETITLEVHDGIIQRFTYDDQWYPRTDGGGFSLEVTDPGHPDVGILNSEEGWTLSRMGGTPGLSRILPGDVNRDGVFSSADLVLVLSAGEYEDAIAGNSTFEEGDWDGDSDFTRKDLVIALQIGAFVEATG